MRRKRDRNLSLTFVFLSQREARAQLPGHGKAARRCRRRAAK